MIEAPWPIPDFEMDLKLEWGPEKTIPALPAPVQDITAEHLKVSTTWPLPRSTNGNAAPSAIPNIPVVPLDVRPTITFRHAVSDKTALIGVNPQWVEPERIGDPTKNEGPLLVSYGLTKLELHVWTGSTWALVAATPKDQGMPTEPLYGSWAPLVKNQATSSQINKQSKLQIWSKNGFDYLRNVHTKTYTDWASGATECAPLPPPQTTCWTVNATDVPGQIASPWFCPYLPLTIAWAEPATMSVTTYMEKFSPNAGMTATGFAFPQWFHFLPSGLLVKQYIVLHVAVPASAVELTFYTRRNMTVSALSANLVVLNTVQSGSGLKTVKVQGQGITYVAIFSSSSGIDEIVEPTVLTNICVTVGPSPADIWQTTIATEHIQEATAYWSQVGDILQPHTTYRFAVTTSVDAEGAGELADYNPPPQLSTAYAYFTTGGPPGTTVFAPPSDAPTSANFDSGLDDLTAYVRQTVPATVPAPGQPPVLPRPVYRAYDLGVVFNENYVDLLYRIAQRDLALYVYDNNNQPVRDAQGRILSLTNTWGHADTLTLTEHDDMWVQAINTGTCTTLDPALFVRDATLQLQGPDLVLSPDTAYEARLIPLLLHDDFNPRGRPAQVSGPQGVMGQWQTVDLGTTGGPSHWEMLDTGEDNGSYRLRQTSTIHGGSATPSDPVKPGTTLYLTAHPMFSQNEQPATWFNYRVSVYVQTKGLAANTIGVAVRMQHAQTYYRYSMLGGATPYRRLVRVVNGVHTVLAEDYESYSPNTDYLVSVEVEDTTIRIFQDGQKVFAVQDNAPILTGSVGLYCWNNVATFRDIRVEGLNVGTDPAPIAYKFGFTTSRFRNVFHHIHSYQDETWQSQVTAAQLPDSLLAKGVTLPAVQPVALSEDEARAYEQTAVAVLGSMAQHPVSAVQITRIERARSHVGFLIQTPEPLDWTRTTLVLRYDGVDMELLEGFTRQTPGAVKIAAVGFVSSDPTQRWIELVVRDHAQLYHDPVTGASGLTNYRIEYTQPDDTDTPLAWKLYYLIGAEYSVTDGLRYRVYDGTPANTPVTPPNIIYRYAVTPSGLQPWLVTETPIAVRVIAPDGTIVHCRAFLPSPYPRTAAIKVLRKADGTGTVVFLNGTPPFAGQTPTYQLQATFRRNNQAVDPSSMILTESGLSDDEVVTIDMPWTAYEIQPQRPS